MTPVQKLRMKRFIKMLENLPAERKKTCIPGNGPLKKWDMQYYGCGTAGCALGTAACHPYFKRHGLETIDEKYSTSGYRSVRFNGNRDAAAGAAFFGITKQQALQLFTGDTCASYLADIEFYGVPLDKVTPKMVAAKARKILALYA